MAHDYVYIYIYIFWAVVSVCWLSKLCPDPHGFVIMFLSSPNSDSAAWGCQQTRCQVFGSNNAWHGFSQSTMQSLSRLSLHCIFRSSWILVLMEVMLQTTSKSLVLFPVVYRGVRRKKTSFGVLPCLEEEAHTYITYWWKRASMMEWHERWDDPANKLNTWDDTYEGWQIVTSSPFFSGFSRSHPNRVKQAVLQMNQSSNNCPKLLHLNAPVTFFMTCSQPKGHESCFFFESSKFHPTN